MITKSGNNYLLGVKGNQPGLYEQIQANTAQAGAIVDRHLSLERNRGRIERREVCVSDNLAGISPEWAGLRQLVKVKRLTRRDGGRWSRQIAYYISSRRADARTYAEGIRGHWRIENSLHWVKDVTFGEDASKITGGQAPENLSIIKNMAINLFRAQGYTNMARAKRLLCNDIEKLQTLIT